MNFVLHAILFVFLGRNLILSHIFNCIYIRIPLMNYKKIYFALKDANTNVFQNNNLYSPKNP